MKYQDKAELLKNATEVTSDFFVKNDPDESFNRVNLTMLADYLEGAELKAGFDMGYYQGEGPMSSWMGARHCGSAGCAVGHGPHAGIPKTTSEDWGAYSKRVFIPKGIHGNAAIWEWCFRARWSAIDNSPQGAAKRIRYLLKHGSDAVEEIMDKGFDHLQENYAEILNAR